MTRSSAGAVDSVTPHGSWRAASGDIRALLVNPWLPRLVELFDVFTGASVDFFRAESLLMLPAPLTTSAVSSPSAPGSDSAPVRITMGGLQTYLSDSMQFLLEVGCRFHPSGVYYLQPSFRAEPMDARHLSQFFHAEAEIAGTIADVMALVERYLRQLANSFLHAAAVRPALAGVLARTEVQAVADGQPFPAITAAEAAGLLGLPVRTRLSAEDERKLLAHFQGGPLWLTDHPADQVPFYQARDNDGLTRTADLLMGIGETVGAGQRHRTAADTLAALSEQGVEAADYDWYLALKAESPIQTAGFGLGIERFLLWLTGHDDIRDVQLLPRPFGEPWVP
jgi:asparaginyl-tRNA synthetase